MFRAAFTLASIAAILTPSAARATALENEIYGPPPPPVLDVLTQPAQAAAGPVNIAFEITVLQREVAALRAKTQELAASVTPHHHGKHHHSADTDTERD